MNLDGLGPIPSDRPQPPVFRTVTPEQIFAINTNVMVKRSEQVNREAIFQLGEAEKEAKAALETLEKNPEASIEAKTTVALDALDKFDGVYRAMSKLRTKS